MFGFETLDDAQELKDMKAKAAATAMKANSLAPKAMTAMEAMRAPSQQRMQTQAAAPAVKAEAELFEAGPPPPLAMEGGVMDGGGDGGPELFVMGVEGWEPVSAEDDGWSAEDARLFRELFLGGGSRGGGRGGGGKGFTSAIRRSPHRPYELPPKSHRRIRPYTSYQPDRRRRIAAYEPTRSHRRIRPPHLW